MKYFSSKIKLSKGFTIVELMVSIGIFALMTALLLAKYGTFNQGVLLTNLAYDVALSIRNAQSYGINVKGSKGLAGTISDTFDYSYGIYLNSGTTAGTYFSGPTGNSIPNTNIVFFMDKDRDGVYDKTGNPDDETISTYKIKRGSTISHVCINSLFTCSGTNYNNVSIVFTRPDPGPTIKSSYSNQPLVYAEITLRTSDNKLKKVAVNKFGQIIIKD